ncbi:hypothetical protein NDU88_007505 [Pleurodeles waltl]|uniref:Uncharacterized protein n=1 Tax=Pleurodeles waltl TaxID=8319 RepID=A0AAV7VUN3_PLEWA|nr:hypothetical protein NDU88_007505 [Pleurodeles waltl]
MTVWLRIEESAPARLIAFAFPAVRLKDDASASSPGFEATPQGHCITGCVAQQQQIPQTAQIGTDASPSHCLLDIGLTLHPRYASGSPALVL